MDTESVRSFVLAAELGQLRHAADELGVDLTPDGRAFLPHARSVVAGVDRAVAAVRPRSRALRIDVLGLRVAPAVVLHEYWRQHPGTDLDVVALKAVDPREAVAAVQAGDLDASFRALTSAAALPPDVRMTHALDSPLELLVGPGHALASARTLTPRQLRAHRIWVPGIAPGSEWAQFYDQLTAEFGLRVDAAGPNFGIEVLFDTLAESSDVATFVGRGDRFAWPAGHGLRRIPVTGPALVYPHFLLFPRQRPHPGLQQIISYFGGLPKAPGTAWRPSWDTPPRTRA